METLQRDLNILTDKGSQRAAKKNAINRIHKLVEDGILERSAQLDVLKRVLVAFEDKVEHCREVAVDIVAIIVQQQEAGVLDWVVPSIGARLAVHPIPEESEEVQLKLFDLAMQCIKSFPNNIDGYIDFYSSILQNCLQQKDPAIKKAACRGCVTLCEVQPKKVKHVALPLAKVVKNQGLNHKHAATRAEAIAALGKLIAHGAVQILGDMSSEQDNRTTVYYIYVLCNDHSEHVRSATLDVLQLLLLDIQERLEQHRRLMPMVMSLMSDASPEIRKKARVLLHNVGMLYEQDNEDNRGDLTKRRVSIKDIQWYADDEFPDMKLLTSSSVPQPDFSFRPVLGARLAVADCVRNFIEAVLKDITALDWTIPFSNVSKRIVALRTLQIAIVYSETNIVVNAQQILDALYKSVKDDDPEIRNESLVALELLGKFMTPAQYLPMFFRPPAAGDDVDDEDNPLVVLDTVTNRKDGVREEVRNDGVIVERKRNTVVMSTAGDGSDANRKVKLPTLFSTTAQSTKSSILTAFRFIVLGSKTRLTQQEAMQITKALCQPELVDLDSPKLIIALIEAMLSFIDVLVFRKFVASPSNPMPDEVRRNVKQMTFDFMLFFSLLSLHACDDAAVKQAVDTAIVTMSNKVTGSDTGIFDFHVGRILTKYVASMPVAVFRLLIQRTTPEELHPFHEAITNVFVGNLAEVDYAMRVTDELRFFSCLNDLLTKKVVAFSQEEIEVLLRSVVFTHAKYHPGPPAHLFRKLALGTLVAMTMNHHIEEDMLKANDGALCDKIVTAWSGAVDCDDGELRHICLSMTKEVLSLPVYSQANAEDVAEHLVNRYDDSSDVLRLFSSQQLATAMHSPRYNTDVTRLGFGKNFAAKVKMLLVHMDDSNDELRRSVCSVIKAVASVDPTTTKNLVIQARSKHATTKYCEEVLVHIGTLDSK